MSARRPRARSPPACARQLRRIPPPPHHLDAPPSRRALRSISIYAALGGVPNWQQAFPKSCTLNSPWPACPWYCDSQSCDECHPNDSGYTRLAQAMLMGMGLTPLAA